MDSETCPTCGGEGQVMDYDVNSGEPYMYDCSTCEGTGEIVCE